MPCCKFDATYDGVATPGAAIGGGFVVPKLTSYDVAPDAVHDSVTEGAATPVVPLDGSGEDGDDGAGTAVENDQTAPGVAPPLFLATTCQ